MGTQEFYDHEKRKETYTKTVYAYLQENTATASMVELATGIHHKNITWIKWELEKVNRLWEVDYKKCERTGSLAWYLTTNEDNKPPDNQLKMF